METRTRGRRLPVIRRGSLPARRERLVSREIWLQVNSIYGGRYPLRGLPGRGRRRDWRVGRDPFLRDGCWRVAECFSETTVGRTVTPEDGRGRARARSGPLHRAGAGRQACPCPARSGWTGVMVKRDTAAAESLI